MNYSKKRLEDMIQKFKAQGYRITPQRLAVLNILAQSTEHPDVEKIYKQVKENFPTTSMATVYKTIVVMKEVGEVIEIAFGDGGNHYDGNKPYPHPHLICTNCKKIIHFNNLKLSCDNVKTSLRDLKLGCNKLNLHCDNSSFIATI